MATNVIDNKKVGYYDSTAKKAHTGNRMLIGQNTGSNSWNHSNIVYINMMKSGQHVGGSNTTGNLTDSKGYIDATTGAWQYRIKIDWIKADTYVLRWTGTCDITLRGGVEDNPDGYLPNRREYTFSTSAISGLQGVIDISGGTCTDIEFLIKDDEAAYDAGQTLSSQFMSDVAGSSMLRVTEMGDGHYSCVKLASELPLYDYIHWNGQNDPDRVNSSSDRPRVGHSFTAQAHQALDADTDLWIGLPAMADDTCVTAILNEVWAVMTPAWKAIHTIWLELGNEAWNSTFKNQLTWHKYGDIASADATCVPATAVCTKVGHGMLTGAEVAYFDNIEHSDYPYSGGTDGGLHIVRDDDDNFRIATRYSKILMTAATKATTCVITVAGHNYSNGDTIHIDDETGMTQLNGLDYIATNISGDDIELYSGGSPVDSTLYGTVNGDGYAYKIADDIISEATLMRYKPVAGSNKARQANYATRAMECWDLAVPIFGSNLVKLLGTKMNDNNMTIEMFDDVPGLREAYDYVAIAPYMSFGGYESDPAGTGDISTATLQQLNDWIMDPEGTIQPQPGYQIPLLNLHILALDTYRIVAYEGGDHNGAANTKWDTQAKRDRVVEWARATEATDAYLWYFKHWASLGLSHFVNFDSHREYSSAGTWGVMEHLGQTDAAEYLGIKPYLDAGGAPKI